MRFNYRLRDNAAIFFAKMGFDNLLLYTRSKDISGQNGYYRAANGIVKINKATREQAYCVRVMDGSLYI